MKTSVSRSSASEIKVFKIKIWKLATFVALDLVFVRPSVPPSVRSGLHSLVHSFVFSFVHSFEHLFTSFIDRWSSCTPLQASQNGWIMLDCRKFKFVKKLLQVNWTCYVLLTIIVGFLFLFSYLFFNDNRQTWKTARPWKLSLAQNFALYVLINK